MGDDLHLLEYIMCTYWYSIGSDMPFSKTWDGQNRTAIYCFFVVLIVLPAFAHRMIAFGRSRFTHCFAAFVSLRSCLVSERHFKIPPPCMSAYSVFSADNCFAYAWSRHRFQFQRIIELVATHARRLVVAAVGSSQSKPLFTMKNCGLYPRNANVPVHSLRFFLLDNIRDGCPTFEHATRWKTVVEHLTL